jgi:hypothetical protein
VRSKSIEISELFLLQGQRISKATKQHEEFINSEHKLKRTDKEKVMQQFTLLLRNVPGGPEKKHQN